MMFYGLDVSRPTIMRWIHRFSELLNDYAEKQKPQVGELWNSDEMTVNIRKKGVKNNTEWIWNLMDSSTRFVLASTITHGREIKDASKVLKQGKKRAGRKPTALITDGLQSYIGANSKVYCTRYKPTTHFRTPAKRKHFLNQNIERINGTYRERLKVMRGLNSNETAQNIIDGERFYYNFIRPHEGLKGNTPASVTGLPKPEGNPWETYIKEALKF